MFRIPFRNNSAAKILVSENAAKLTASSLIRIRSSFYWSRQILADCHSSATESIGHMIAPILQPIALSEGRATRRKPLARRWIFSIARMPPKRADGVAAKMDRNRQITVVQKRALAGRTFLSCFPWSADCSQGLAYLLCRVGRGRLSRLRGGPAGTCQRLARVASCLDAAGAPSPDASRVEGLGSLHNPC